MLQYNLLSVVKRFIDYETLGELFRASQKDALKLSITEQIQKPTASGLIIACER